MNEGRWLAGTDPQAMLAYLRGRVSERKLRLFACAVCARGDLPGAGRGAVEVAEWYADGGIGAEELWTAYGILAETGDAARRVAVPRAFDVGAARDASTWGIHMAGLRAAARTQEAGETEAHVRTTSAQAEKAEAKAHCELVREIAGDPFRRVAVSPGWLTWSDGAVAKLARVIYNDRRFDELPILGDALEDAGCRDSQVLSHCRARGPHMRGCWVLDIILAKDR